MQFTHNSSFTDKTECSLNFIYLCLRGVRPRSNAASMKVINKVSERALITSWTWHSPFHSENCKYQQNLCPFQALFLIRRSKQNEEMLSFSVDSVVSAAMNFFSPCSESSRRFFGLWQTKWDWKVLSLFHQGTTHFCLPIFFHIWWNYQMHLYQTRMHCVSELFSKSF